MDDVKCISSFVLIAMLSLLPGCGGGSSGPPVTIELKAWTVSPDAIGLDWTNGNDVNRYRIYQDGIAVGLTFNADHNEEIKDLKPSAQYCFVIRAHRAKVLLSDSSNRQISNTACATTLPNLPPTMPVNLSVLALPSHVDQMVLSWNISTDDYGVKGYKIYRDGVFLKSTADNSSIDETVSPGEIYCYQVSAYDQYNAESSKSACGATRTNLPPTVPTNLSVVGLPSPVNQMVLSWDNSFDEHGVKGYKIYRDGAFLKSWPENWSIDEKVSPGKIYCYQVSAYDQYDEESPKSAPECEPLLVLRPAAKMPFDNGQTANADTEINGESMTWTTVAELDGRFSSISLDSLDYTYLAYQAGDQVKLLTNRTGFWNSTTLDSQASYPILATDKSNNIHLGFMLGLEARYATNSSGSWVVESIRPAGSAKIFTDDVAMAPGIEAEIHASLRNGSTGQLQYANRTLGSWIFEDIGETAAEVGDLVLDSEENVHVSYVDGITHHLMYATNASGEWLTRAIDIGGSSRSAPAMAIDVSDNIHIAFYDDADNALNIAHNVFGDWDVKTIVKAGRAFALATDSAGSQHLSYINNSDLKYATNKSGAWKIYTLRQDIHPYEDFTKGTDIAIDSIDRVHIGYYRGDVSSAYITNR